MKYLISLLFVLSISTSFAQKAIIEIERELHDTKEIEPYNFNREPYNRYLKDFNDRLLSFFADWGLQQDIQIRQNLAPNLTPTYEFSARPALLDSVKYLLEDLLYEITPVTALHVPFSALYTIKLNGGCKKRGLEYSPVLKSIREKRYSVYENADLGQRFEQIKKWIDKEAIPLALQIILQASINGNNKEQTRKKILRAMAMNERAFVSKASKKPRLYIEFLEVEEFHKLILPTSKTLMLASEGRFSYARTYMEAIYQFAGDDQLIRYLLDGLNWRMAFYEEMEKEATADELLKVNPNSEMGWYNKVDIKASPLISNYTTHKEREVFLSINPMRKLTVPPVNKAEAYQNNLRNITNDMFIDAETFDSEFPRYGEIALELGAYEFAVDYYWMIANFNSTSSHSYPIDAQLMYDYALYKYGIERDFDKKRIKQFKRLDKKLRKRMKHHSVYKDF